MRRLAILVAITILSLWLLPPKTPCRIDLAWLATGLTVCDGRTPR